MVLESLRVVVIIFNAYVRVCSVAHVPNVCMFVEARAHPSLDVILRNTIRLLGDKVFH